MKRRPRPERAEVLLVEWLQLLQMLGRQGSLQGLAVEGVQVHMGRSQGDPGDSEST